MEMYETHTNIMITYMMTYVSECECYVTLTGQVYREE